MAGFRKLLLASVSAGVLGWASSAHAALLGKLYLQNPGGSPSYATIPDVPTAVSLITSTGNTIPNASFTSNHVNGIDYNSSDGGTIAAFLGSDNASNTGQTGGPLGSFVLDLNGSFVAPSTGLYTFTSNLDDGGGFFVDGTPGVRGSGTAVGTDNGDHAAQVVTGTLNLSAGVHQVEYVYYNQGCAGCGYTGNQDNSGGGAQSLGVQISAGDLIANGGVAVVTSIANAPEPTSIALAAVGALGLLARRTRRSAC